MREAEEVVLVGVPVVMVMVVVHRDADELDVRVEEVVVRRVVEVVDAATGWHWE